MPLGVFRGSQSPCSVRPCLAPLLMLVAFQAALGCRLASVDHTAEFQVVTLQGCDREPHQLGYLLGNHTADMIKGRLAESTAAQRCRDFIATPHGTALFQALKAQHAAAYPAVWQELRGTAAGAGVALDEVLILNLRQELLAAAAAPSRVQVQEESCSDVALKTTTHPSSSSSSRGVSRADGSSSSRAVHSRRHQLRRLTRRRHLPPSSLQGMYQATQPKQQQQQGLGVLGSRGVSPGCGAGGVVLLGHNEDMSRDTLGRVFFVSYQGATPATTWFAFVYAGELPSSGFGVNSAGVGFTLNALFPAAPLLPGVGRNWVSRQLLGAGDMRAALELVATPGQVVGHGYNLLHLPTCTLVNAEVGPGGTASTSPLGPSSWYFHANMYKRLVVGQRTDSSSLHREKRALELPAPADLAGLLSILGDEGDPAYPIYRGGTSPVDAAVLTLCTAVVDVGGGVLRVLAGNPTQQRVVLTLDVHTWRLTLPGAAHPPQQQQQQQPQVKTSSSRLEQGAVAAAGQLPQRLKRLLSTVG